jgi:hypothetical protein
MIRAFLAISCAAALVLAGCGTTTRSGHIGETFSGGGLRVTVERVDQHPPVPAGDVTGLSSPAPGDRLLGARVHICSKQGAAIGTYDFALALDGGGAGRVKFPQENYANAFESLRTGCARGWIVFELPRASRVSTITFAFDDTGTSNANGSGRPESHERFSWSLT